MERISLNGQVVIVTGGGRGIGRAHCLEFARRGASVVVNDMAVEHADGVVAEVEAAGGAAVASYDSVATPEGAKDIVDIGVKAFGTVDVVVNNAGFMRNGYFEEQTPEMLDAILDVHVRGTFFVTQAAWPILREKQYGRVILTSSGGGMFAMQGEANYAAAKSAMYGLTKALAFEGEPDGILVNTILPSAQTTITLNDPVPGMEGRIDPGMRDALAGRRQPEAVSPFVAYLGSPACTVNGEAYLIGCGIFSRVFVGVTPGWVAPDADNIQIEDIVEHLDAIRAQDGYQVFENNFDKDQFMAATLGWQA